MAKSKMEVLLWSIALPGFGQLLNQHYVKGVLLIVLEVIINVIGRLNMAIVHSFQGNTWQAVLETDYQWVMFYPCVYMFGMWDAFQGAGGIKVPYGYVPFVCAAFLGTVGVAYSSVFTVFGVLLGPVWLPILCILIGVGIGYVIRLIVMKKNPVHT